MPKDVHTMPETIPRYILVEGDPVLGMDTIVSMKRKWVDQFPGSIVWSEMCPPKKTMTEFLNALDGEVSTSDWGETHKIVFLRGLVNTKLFKDSLLKIITTVSSGNTLLVFDETGVIASEEKGAKADSGGWKSFKQYFEKNGSTIQTRPPFKDLDKAPWGERFGNGHVKAIVSEFEQRGRKISPHIVRDVFLEMVEPNWSFILGEIDKITDVVDSGVITQQDVMSIVFPTAPSHAIFEFAVAFNSGNYQKIMDSYDELIKSKIHYDVIFSFCMKLIRWQMIAAHLASYGQSLPTSLVAIASRMNKEDAYSRTEKLRKMKPSLFKDDETKSKKDVEEQKEGGITPFMAKGVSDFVKNVLPKRVPIRSGKLETLPFVGEVMMRYLTMVNCMENVRLGGKDKARPEFRQAMFKICWRSKL